MPGAPDIIMHSDLLYMKGKDRAIKQLIHFNVLPGENHYDREWLFADLKDDEDAHTMIREKSRWAGGGNFVVSDTVEQDTADLDDSSLPTIFEIR
jgi:hypothetical protein